jgi:hypothetical protein
MPSLLRLLLPALPLLACCSKVQLIIDTDLGFDVDDVGAIAVGQVRLEARDGGT